MDDDGDGGEQSNAIYYSWIWTKGMKVRVCAKRVKHKRHSKKVVHLGNVPVSTMKHRFGLHHKGIHTTHRPHLRR